jgi:hypothetical protein
MAHVVVSGAQVHARAQVDERESERLLVQDHVEGLHIAVHHAWSTDRDEVPSQKKRDTAEPLMRGLQSVAKIESLEGLATAAPICCHITMGAYDLYGEQPTRQVYAVPTSFLAGAGQQYFSSGAKISASAKHSDRPFPYGLTCCVSQIVPDSIGCFNLNKYLAIESPFKIEEALGRAACIVTAGCGFLAEDGECACSITQHSWLSVSF